MKITKQQLRQIIQEELDASLPSDGDPAKQEYDALTTMINRVNGMLTFLLNTTRRKSDEALTQQAAKQANALGATLEQLRKGIK
mgnify:CR=1 FL=1